MRVLPLFTLSLFAATAFAADECPPPYSYCGYTGPAQWPNIAITGKENECAGTRQSPINLPSLPLTPGPLIEVKYVSGKATILNTGHDIEVTPAENKSTLTIGKDVYTLVKFHFHVRSEHRIHGQDQPAEIHFVHSRVEGDKTYTAVIGVLLRAGAEYPGLKPVFARLPKKVCEKFTDVAINFSELLPAKLGHCYTYTGSLTTPPCSQNVTWYVLAAPRTILDSDLRSLTALGSNARPIQVNQPSLPVAFVRPQ